MSEKNQRLVCGIGINDYQNCEDHIRSVWHDMITRSYSIKLHNRYPTYIGCSVDPSWHRLSNFRTWFLQTNYKPGLQLDKDITNRGNKIYGPSNCSFVSGRINKLIIGNGRGSYKVGVYFNKFSDKFMAYCNVNSKRKHLGYFDTETEAFLAYKSFKEANIKVVAKEEYQLGNCTKEVRDALLGWII